MGVSDDAILNYMRTKNRSVTNKELARYFGTTQDYMRRRTKSLVIYGMIARRQYVSEFGKVNHYTLVGAE